MFLKVSVGTPDLDELNETYQHIVKVEERPDEFDSTGVRYTLVSAIDAVLTLYQHEDITCIKFDVLQDDDPDVTGVPVDLGS